MDCPKCQSPVPAKNVNVHALIAKCDACDAVFRVEDYLADSKALRAPRPSTLIVEENGDVRVIRRRWYRPSLRVLLFFCIAWDSFLVCWYAMALIGPGQGGFEIIAVIFPICHVAVGIGLTYSTIVGFLNRSYLGIAGDRLFVRHRPVPWMGNKEMASAEVRELFVERNHAEQNGQHFAQQKYNLSAVTNDGRSVKLLGGLDPAEARFIAQTLNDWLKLPPSRLGLRFTDN